MIGMKAAKVTEFDGSVIHVVKEGPVVNALDIVMHCGACGSGFVAILVPARFNLVARHTVILAFQPVRSGHHPINDCVGVKVVEMFMVPCCYGRVFDRRIAVDGVNVGTGIKRDSGVSTMRIFLFEE